MIDTLVIKTTQFEKTGSIDEFFISLGNLKKLNSTKKKQEVPHVFRDLHFLLSHIGVRLPFSKRNEQNLVLNQKSNLG